MGEVRSQYINPLMLQLNITTLDTFGPRLDWRSAIVRYCVGEVQFSYLTINHHHF
jgi:hypothetical protein